MSLLGFGGGNNTIDELEYIKFRGDYASGTIYDKYDIVAYNGVWYLCLLSVRGITPAEGIYWTAMGARPLGAEDALSCSATVVAAENLGGHRVVTLNGNYASKDNAAHKFTILGLTRGAATMGSPADVITFGLITEGSWNWTEGSPVFLATNGLLTQTPPTSGFRIIIGRPQTATTLFVDISEPIIIL